MFSQSLKRCTTIPFWVLSACLAGSAYVHLNGNIMAAQERQRFVGGLQNYEVKAESRIAVRNDVAQDGEEIVTLRYFKIQKGVFPEFYEASVEGVWPYFEKIGARVIGMWQVVHPTVDDRATGEEDAEYDEVILMTRYAGVDHWRATRDTYQHGGNGPDWEKCMAAINFRRSLTIETSLQFLKGHKWDNSPWYMPGLAETSTVTTP